MHKFFLCKHCGNLIGLVNNSGVPLVCCGENMTELKPNTTEAATEKHLPVVAISGGKINVKVGSVPHPMTTEHNISFIYVETTRGGQRKNLKPGEKPEHIFTFVDDKPVAIFAYCNLHGLWKTEIK